MKIHRSHAEGAELLRRDVRITADVAATLLCAIGALMILANLQSPLRSGLVATALVVGTGWAATFWIEFEDAAFAACVSLGVGLSLVFLYALFFVEIGWWHPVGSAGGLLFVAAGINASALFRDVMLGRVR